MKKIFRWILILILTPILLVLSALTVVSLMGITINLDGARPMVEKAATAALERKVLISGSVELLPTLRPMLEVQGLRIDNPEDWGNPDFVAVKLVRIKLGLIDLIRKKISIDEITAEGVSMYLESRKNDINNWSFVSSDEKQTASIEESLDTDETSGTTAFKAVDTISLKTIDVVYKDTVLDKTISFQLNELIGEAPAGKSFVFHAKGDLQGQVYSLDLEAGALDTFHPRLQAWPLDLSGSMAGTPFSAQGDIGYKNDEEQLSIDVSIGAVNIGGLLNWFNIADDIKASTEELGLTFHLRGESLHELLSQSEFNCSLKGGTLDLGNPKSDSDFIVTQLNGSVGAKPGSPIGIILNGSVGVTPVKITIQGMPLADYINEPGELPVSITFTAAGAELDFSGAIDLPVNSKSFNMAMTLEGEKLDLLDEFLNIALPPLGPYSLKAQFSTTEKGYELSNLGMKVGSSDLSGSMSIDKSGERPDVTLQLISNVLQLDDFELGDWSPDGKKDSVATEGGEEKEEVVEKEKPKAGVPSFLSVDSLARFNGTVSIEMKKVLSGNDTLGNGSLKSTLQMGHFSIAPLQLDLADGTANLEFSFYPTTEHTEIHLGSQIRKLDIGIIAHRAKPDSDMGGVLSLDLELDSTAPDLKNLMAHANGHFDLAFIPVNFDASLVDLWATNLLAALATEVDGGPKSVINCLVASFSMKDGMMHERTIFMDTTHMSIEGEANINFKTEELKVKMAPKAKRPEFFSMATPVKVKGSFEEFRVRINKLRLTASLASFITSPIHVPLRRIFEGERPEDGVEACRAAWDNRKVEKQAESGLGD